MTEINQLLQTIFIGMDFTWDLEKKDMNEAEIVIAQLNGTSDWIREDEVVHYLDEKADETFWEYVYGLHIVNYPLVKGCNCCCD